MTDPLRIAVIGAGAFGRNHLRVLHELSGFGSSNLTPEQVLSTPGPPTLTPQHRSSPPVHLAAAVDTNPETRAAVTATYNIPTFATVDDLLAARLDLHAATIAVPTSAHAQVATHLLEAGLDVLIEKPITATLAEADALIALAATRGRLLAAGHLERFNPAVSATFSRLTRPMFFEAHRLSVFTPRSLDVDVVLDLMIHDLDILLTMAQASAPNGAANPVTEVRAVGLPVLSRQVDIANVRLEFSSGAVANLTASRVSTEQVRKLRLFQPAQYLSLDYARQELLTINISPELSDLQSRVGGLLSPHTGPGAPAGGTPLIPSQHPSTGLTFDKSAIQRVEPLRLELEDFLQAVSTRSQPRVTGPAARAALALALEINEAIQQHTTRANLHQS